MARLWQEERIRLHWIWRWRRCKFSSILFDSPIYEFVILRLTRLSWLGSTSLATVGWKPGRAWARSNRRPSGAFLFSGLNFFCNDYFPPGMVKWLLDQRANLHSELLKRELLQTSSVWIQPVDLLCLHIFNSTIALSNTLETTCSGRPRTTPSMGTAIATRAWVLKPWVQRQTTGAVATGRWTPTWAAWWTLWTTWWGTMGWDLVFCVCVCVCI